MLFIEDSFMNTNESKSMLMRPFSPWNNDSTDGRDTWLLNQCLTTFQGDIPRLPLNVQFYKNKK